MKPILRVSSPLLVLLAAISCALVLAVGGLFAAPATAHAAPAAKGDGTYGFSDVTPGDWYANDNMLGYAVSHGFLKGYEDGRFGAYDNVTRGQVATILYRMAGEPEATALPFDDVDYTSYYGDAIIWARSTGVITGYMNSEGIALKFGPDDPVTREQLAVMLARYARVIQGTEVRSDRNKMRSMPDSADVSFWAATAVGWCFDYGVLSGDYAGEIAYIKPQGTAARAHIAKMVSVLSRDILGEAIPPNGGKGATPPYDPGDNKAAATYMQKRFDLITDAYNGDTRIHGTGFSQQDKVNAYSQYNSAYLEVMYEALDYACGMSGIYDADTLLANQDAWELQMQLDASNVGSSIFDPNEAMVKVAENNIMWVANQATHLIGLVANP